MSRGTSCGQLWCREAVKLRKCPSGVGGRRHPGVSGQQPMAGPTLPGPFPPAFPARARPTGRCQPRRCVLTPGHRAASRAVVRSCRPSGAVAQTRLPHTNTDRSSSSSSSGRMLCCCTAAFQGFVSGSQPRSPSSIVGHNNCRCGTSPTPQTNASKSTPLPRLAQLRSSSRLCPSTLQLSTRPPKISTA